MRALFVVCTGAVLLGGSCAASAASLETYSAPLPRGEWMPTFRQYGDALEVFKYEYARWEHKTGRTLRRFSDYRFQYYGVREKGRNLVFLNAFCSEYWEQAPEWRTRFVAVEGGGSCFFRAKVDVASGSIVELTMNREGAVKQDPEPKEPRD
jgi:hypothetical protein